MSSSLLDLLKRQAPFWILYRSDVSWCERLDKSKLEKPKKRDWAAVFTIYNLLFPVFLNGGIHERHQRVGFHWRKRKGSVSVRKSGGSSATAEAKWYHFASISVIVMYPPRNQCGDPKTETCTWGNGKIKARTRMLFPMDLELHSTTHPWL